VTTVRRPDRRSVLKWAAVGATALAGGLATRGVLAANGVAPPTPGKSDRFELRGRSWHVIGVARGDLPKPGDQLAVTGELLGNRGQKIGEFYASSIFVGSPHGAGAGAASYVETHHFNLPDGTLVGSGTWHVNSGSRFAIVGGTGRYAGASGTYQAEQRPIQLGGDGSASFTFELNVPGGANGGS
jgi:hypothetical protein